MDRKKGRILQILFDELLKISPIFQNASVPYPAILEIIKDKDADKVLASLTLEGYITKSFIKDQGIIRIKMTNKGILAQADNYFINKHKEKMWKRFIDLSLTLCNIIVAIAAITALRNDSTSEKMELRALRVKVDSIERQLQLKPLSIDTVDYLKIHTIDTSK